MGSNEQTFAEFIYPGRKERGGGDLFSFHLADTIVALAMNPLLSEDPSKTH